MRFDLTDLRLFMLVVEAGSITQGARLAHLALPSASERLRGMEEKAGVALLDRGRRGVSPTRAGDVVYRHARGMLRQARQLHAELAAFTRDLNGTVRLLANTAACTGFLPDALAPFLVRHPRLDVDLRETSSREIVQAITGEKAELGIISGAVTHAGLQTHPFARDQLVLVVPHGHPLAALERIPFQEALRHELVGLTEGSALQRYLQEQAGQPLRLRIRVPHFEDICRMVARGAGLGIVSETAARRAAERFELGAIRIAEEWAHRELLLCARDFAALPAASRALADHLTGAPPPP